MSFNPKFTVSTNMAKCLMDIESLRQQIESAPFSVQLLQSLRESAKLATTHYSTQIEGNKLTLGEVQQVVKDNLSIPGKARDQSEVLFHQLGINYVEELSKKTGKINASQIKILHGLIQTGKRRQSDYRDGQNVIRDSRTGGIVYMPPESQDVPDLMQNLLTWVNTTVKASETPIVIIAAVAHYQYVTIHPYYDGNGRTARLITNLILKKYGYGLKGLFSLEEFYVDNLEGYYSSLSVGPSHNYYLGRAEADISQFLEYFCNGMRYAFERVKTKAEESKKSTSIDQSIELRNLDHQQRELLTLFLKSKYIRTTDIESHLNIPIRTINKLCKKWIDRGFIEIHDRSKKTRSYRLAKVYESLIQSSYT
jgi:Fic family protein